MRNELDSEYGSVRSWKEKMCEMRSGWRKYKIH